MSDKEKQQLVSEVNILRELKHSNIVKYVDRIIDKNDQTIFIVMEYCAGGDMAQLIKNSKRRKEYIPENLLWKIIAQIVYALHHCHQKKILHRDLKPGNVFLDKNKNVKLGDFGLSRIMGEESVYAYTHVGTPYYMSPEQINDSKYNDRSDIWSLGCVIYEIAALKPPFQAKNHYMLSKMIKSGEIDQLPAEGKYSAELSGLIFSMLQQDPSKRPSALDLCQQQKVATNITERANKEKERSILSKHNQIKKKEEDYKRKLAEIKERESKVQMKEEILEETEQRIKEHQKRLIEQERVIEEQEKILHEKERSLQTREIEI